MNTILISSIAMHAISGQRDLQFRCPIWAQDFARSNGFELNASRRIFFAGKAPLISMNFSRQSPSSTLSFYLKSRSLGNEGADFASFGNRGVYEGSAAADSMLRSMPKVPLRYPLFGDDLVAQPDVFGYVISAVGYFYKCDVTIADNLKRDPRTRAFKSSGRDQSADPLLAEKVLRRFLSQFVSNENLVSSEPCRIGGQDYSCFHFSNIPTRFQQAMSRPTTRWIKLSDWARNHDVTVTYGDMTAEYIYRGERYLLPLASDQFKKGTAWFKTSGPILMRGDDWLIPTAMVD